MNRSAWKSGEELELLLGGARRISIFACGVCANLSDTGGPRGIKNLKRLLELDGREVVCAECITACCAEPIMREAIRRHWKAIQASDALVVISCAAGVKSAFLCDPGTPVVAAADSIGSVPVSRRDDPVARSQCVNCGHCVITFTGGICPLSECPANRKYEPCSRFGELGERCVTDPTRYCVWREIERRGDLEALKQLGRLQDAEDFERLSFPVRRSSPEILKRISGWAVARSGWFARLVPFIN